MDKADINAQKIDQLERRVTKLEEQRECDKTQVYELDKSLGIFVNEMKNISSELKTIVSNFKEAIVRATEAQGKEIQALKERVVEQEHKIEKLDNKIEKETVIANSDKWKKYTSYVATAILSGIIAFILTHLGLK